MREIKFRAWNKKVKLMFMVNDIDGMLQNTNITCEHKGYCDCVKTTVCCKHGTACSCMEGIEGWLDEVELMQYTGLKDKNGVEIYEGDILKNDFNNPPHQEVIWSEYYGGWCLGDEDTYPIQKYRTHEFWEIVGNIHENPELLKEAI